MTRRGKAQRWHSTKSSLGLAQVFYRHGRLRMYRQCQAVRVAGQDGLTIVVNGLVRISYRDPFGSHQQFFLGTGAANAAPNVAAPKLSTNKDVNLLVPYAHSCNLFGDIPAVPMC